MRVNPTSLRDATEHAEVQKIPGWSGFNAILYPEMPQESNIGYCPMIDGASTEFSTVYTVLKDAQMLSSALGQGDAVITFDLLIYMKAKQIQCSTTRKVKVKASDEKITTVSADRELFGRLLIVANARQVNLKEVMSYELSPIPYALTHHDGSLRKTTKSQLADILEKNVEVFPHIQSTPVTLSTSWMGWLSYR